MNQLVAVVLFVGLSKVLLANTDESPATTSPPTPAFNKKCWQRDVLFQDLDCYSKLNWMVNISQEMVRGTNNAPDPSTSSGTSKNGNGSDRFTTNVGLQLPTLRLPAVRLWVSYDYSMAWPLTKEGFDAFVARPHHIKNLPLHPARSVRRHRLTSHAAWTPHPFYDVSLHTVIDTTLFGSHHNVEFTDTSSKYRQLSKHFQTTIAGRYRYSSESELSLFSVFEKDIVSLDPDASWKTFDGLKPKSYGLRLQHRLPSSENRVSAWWLNWKTTFNDPYLDYHRQGPVLSGRMVVKDFLFSGFLASFTDQYRVSRVIEGCSKVGYDDINQLCQRKDHFVQLVATVDWFLSPTDSLSLQVDWRRNNELSSATNDSSQHSLTLSYQFSHEGPQRDRHADLISTFLISSKGRHSP